MRHPVPTIKSSVTANEAGERKKKKEKKKERPQQRRLVSAPGSVIDHMAPTRGRFSGRMIAGDDDIIPHHMYQLEGPCLLAAD